jgi:hypothetical protein
MPTISVDKAALFEALGQTYESPLRIYTLEFL